MKSVLIICQHFIPYTPSLGRVIRMVTLINFLLQNGYKIIVLTSKGVKFDYFGYKDLIDKISIHYLGDPLKTKVQKRQAHKIYSSHPGPGSNIIPHINKALKFLVESLSIPDLGIFMVNKYTQAAIKIIDSEDIQNVLVSSPPHSMQLVGLRLKRKFGDKINFIADYRDSWNASPAFSKAFVLSNALSEKMEKSVLEVCDHFMYVSSPMLDKIKTKYALDIEGKAHLVMNGISKKYVDKSDTLPARHNKCVRIGYFGQISDRPENPHSIVNLLHVLENPETINYELRFELYGAVEFTSAATLESKYFVKHDSIPHHEALRKMAEMDFLLFLYSDPKSSDEVISGKLFEYISVSKPIFCLGPKNMEARRIVEKYGIGIVADIENPTDIEEKLKSLPGLRYRNFYENLDISIFQREKQYSTLLDLMR